MSLSDAPEVKITTFTAQNISDEILGGTIQFCRETGYEQNIEMLTFFFAAFMFTAKNELNEHKLTLNVQYNYVHSLCIVFPELDKEMQKKVFGLLYDYWENLSKDFSSLESESEISALLQIADKLNRQGSPEEQASLKVDPLKPFKQVSNAISSSIYRILRQIDNGLGIQYKGVLDQIRFARYFQESNMSQNKNKPQSSTNTSNGGCYVATCVYGSYDCPQVWTLRRYRDNTLASTWYGRFFIHVYYAISPTIVKWFGNAQWFKKMWKSKLDKMVSNLQANGVEDTPYQDKNWKK